MVKIEGLYRSAGERLEATLGKRIFKERMDEAEDTFSVILDDYIILKHAGDGVKIDLGGKVEYLGLDDFVQMVII